MIETLNEFRKILESGASFSRTQVEGMLEDIYMHVAQKYNDQGMKTEGEYRNEAVEYVKNYLKDK
jgi:hypothetical protein